MKTIIGSVTSILLGSAILLLSPADTSAKEPAVQVWLQAKAYCVPKETAPEGEGYFSIVEGHDGRLYIGTHANGKNAWLVQFDPTNESMAVVVDAQRAVGTSATGFAAQAKIHTRNNVGASGKIYFATKQGYPTQDEKRADYPGGYPMVYDPSTGNTKVYPIPVPHQGIISVTPDESRGLAYLSTCSDERPDSTHFVVLDLFKETYVDLMDCRHMYAFIAVDYKGRAYHPILGGDIARYDPETHKLERLKQTIDGRPPSPDSHLADEGAHPINWDISPDRKTLYAQPMSGNILYAYDLAAATDTLPGRSLGPALAGGTNTDCRALCVGPRGTVWCSVTAIPAPSAESELHIVRFRPGTDSTPVDLGRVFVSNPEFTAFKDADGKPLPFHGGFRTLTNGKMVTRHMSLGICEGRDGSLYLLEIQPYTVLKIAPSVLTQRQ